MDLLMEVRRYRSESDSHSHGFHQVVLPLEGELGMVVGGVAGAVSAQCVALVAAGQPHSFVGSRSNAFLVADVPADSPPAREALALLLWERARHEPFVAIDVEQHQLIRFLAGAAERGTLRGATVSQGCALLLGTLAVQLGLDERGTWPASLRAVSSYADSHLEWPLDVADLARVGNTSVSRLHALFRAHLDTTPRRYLTRRRLERACDLLASTALPVVEVAQRVGYGDQAAFSRAFRRHTGTTPVQYRAASARRESRHKRQ